MIRFGLMDIPPGPGRLGVALSAILFVVALVGLIAGALAVLLWYRKRSLRTVETVRRESLASAPVAPIQPSNPNQP